MPQPKEKKPSIVNLYYTTLENIKPYVVVILVYNFILK